MIHKHMHEDMNPFDDTPTKQGGDKSLVSREL